MARLRRKTSDPLQLTCRRLPGVRIPSPLVAESFGFDETGHPFGTGIRALIGAVLTVDLTFLLVEFLTMGFFAWALTFAGAFGFAAVVALAMVG